MTAPREAQPVLRGSKVLLRPWAPGDADEVYAACQDAEIQRWTTVPSPYRHTDVVGYVTELAPAAWDLGGAVFAVVDVATGRPAGSIGAHEMRDGVARVGTGPHRPPGGGASPVTRCAHSSAGSCGTGAQPGSSWSSNLPTSGPYASPKRPASPPRACCGNAWPCGTAGRTSSYDRCCPATQPRRRSRTPPARGPGRRSAVDQAGPGMQADTAAGQRVPPPELPRPNEACTR
jgi:hypothetical protein